MLCAPSPSGPSAGSACRPDMLLPALRRQRMHQWLHSWIGGDPQPIASWTRKSGSLGFRLS